MNTILSTTMPVLSLSAAAIKRDKRYTVSLEYCGYATPRYIARFCDDWIECAETENEAWELCKHAEDKRMSPYFSDVEKEEKKKEMTNLLESSLNYILEHIRDSRRPFAGENSFQERREEIARHARDAKRAFEALFDS